MSFKLKEVFGEEWYELLKPMLSSPKFTELGKFIESRRKSFNVEVYPLNDKIFTAFKLTPLNKLKVVILGGSPFCKSNIATGIAYGAPELGPLPSTTKQLLKIVEDDIYDGLHLNCDVTLKEWSEQGVLLLNTTLTVERNKPNAHTKEWEFFIKGILYLLKDTNDIIYIFFDEDSKKYKSYITNKSSIIMNGSVTCFSEINNKLLTLKKPIIKW